MKDIFWLTDYVRSRTGIHVQAGGLKRLLDHLVRTGVIPESRSFKHEFHGTVDIRVKAVIEALKTPEGREATKPRTSEEYPVEERLSKLKFSEPMPPEVEVAEWEGLPPLPEHLRAPGVNQLPVRKKRAPRKPKP